MHAMIDLETVGTGSNAAIVSIGAVLFDQTSVYIDTALYTPVDVTTCYEVGLTWNQDTIDWWAKQPKEAQAVFFDENKTDIRHAVTGFEIWLPQDCKVWGNGASFDNVILANAYRACQFDTPWRFWNDRCFRTIAAGLPGMQRFGTHHNALDDAVSQAQHLVQHAPHLIL